MNPVLIMSLCSTYPYENLSSALHLAMIDAARPANSAVQSKNMWKESEIRPRLKYILHGYTSKKTYV